ncbi:S1 RNA-binding domain-containing protein [Clostridium sp. D2Q-14]|uniref:CvfB family protein n=1 Tax=Anaeromonas gelatinilytica TaxID=2683194 RepID=UPI00193C3E14|nr:S1-like domain-containing RNA-binding protein [Anaeromonas gelatinilytica]MBS4536554.1 S1 RNA-binding domain-containing protein [Anaeromonas gelatinilytica]
MIKLGKIQELIVDRLAPQGVYLKSIKDENNETVLLPLKEVNRGVEIGDRIEVFVYRDSNDRVISTTKRPKLTLGDIGFLEVVDITKIGSFMDWGLEKDLFLPFREQRGRLKKGREYLVGVYIDKSDRLCATMNVYDMLDINSTYKENDKVEGMVYNINPDMGVFVAIDKKYHGLIPKQKVFRYFKLGEKIEARVVKVRSDGKLELSIRKKAYKQMDVDADEIISKLKSNGGVLMLNDKSSPDLIKKQLQMSKGAFKRAIGRLLKENKIEFVEGGIKLI